jgi:hypothetical protein
MILTKDEDLYEQTYKLQWLLDTHYRSMLIAKLYANEPGRFHVRAMPTDISDLNEAFKTDDGMLIERTDNLVRDVLPRTCHSAPFHCVLLKQNKLSSITFNAETEMAELLEVKGQTLGLNTNLLGGKNCHLWLGQMRLPGELRGFAAIAHDRRLKKGRFDIPFLELIQAINCIERFQHIEVQE